VGLAEQVTGAGEGVSAAPFADEKRPYTVIATGFTLVVLVMVLLTVFSVARLQGINSKLAVVVGKHNVATELAYRIHIAARERVLLLQAILLTEDAFDQDEWVQRFHRAAFDVGMARKALLEMPLSVEAGALLAEQGRYIAQAQPLQEDALALAMAGKSDEARQFLLKSVVPAQDRTLASLAKLLNLELEESRHAADESKREYEEALAFVGTFGLVGVALGVLTGGYVFRKMKTAMIKLAEVSDELSKALNDLRYRQFAMDQHAIVSIADAAGNITYVNDKLSEISGYSRDEFLGQNHRMLKSGHHTAEFFDEMWQTIVSGKVWQGEVCNRNKFGNGYWVATTIVPCLDENDLPYQYISIRTDITALKEVQNALALNALLLEQTVETRTKELAERGEAMEQTNAELKAMNVKLQDVQHQLLQSEKMASVGQLAAGVAHEINNPISYVYSNIGTLEKHLVDLFDVLAVYELADSAIADNDALLRVQSAKAKADLEFLKEDLPTLLSESKEGISRVKKIVQDLKDFSHVDASDEWQLTNLHRGLDSTLNIVSNEIKYKADVIKEYEDLPDVECLPSQINQVLLNLLVNAAHAIEERGTITLRTGCRDGEVWVEVEDTGKGIAPEHMKKIFDPFFTTKPIGKGTGLGLSLSYGIIHKHHGRIEVRSELGKGSAFRVWLPVRQSEVQLAQGLTAQ